jgi:RimJ/RimL family protein N-acetyltransferase
MMIGTLRLETPRLVLRPTQLEDFEAWAEFMSDDEATRFIGGRQPRSVAWRSFLTMAGAWSLQRFAMFSVVEKSSGRWVGRVGPWMPEGWPGTEIGWGIVRDRWCLGYATEAAAAAADWSLATLGWRDFIHVIDAGNLASRAVARKLGSRNLGAGRLPAPYDDAEVEIWGQTADAWRANREAIDYRLASP